MSTVATYPHDSALRRILIAIFLLGATSFGSAMAAITVGPDSDAACDYHHVGSAVAAAIQSPGFNLVAISTGTYSAISTIHVNSADDLLIEGGFANCSAGLSTGTSTLDGAGAAQPGSIISHLGTGKLTLLHLGLTHGDGTTGGGINSQGSGELVLDDVAVFANHSNYGGGLYVAGGLSVSKSVNLFGVRVIDNIADANGGGLFAAHADVSITGSRLSYFLGNKAQGEVSDTGDGGAIYALNSGLHVRTASVTFPFIGSNHANRNGGGIYFGGTGIGSDGIFLNMGNTLAEFPLLISDNWAQFGGALYMNMEASGYLVGIATLYNVRIEDNNALYGGAIYSNTVATGSENVTSGIAMRSSLVGDSNSAPACAPEVPCNTISGNRGFYGGIIVASASGEHASSRFDLLRGQMRYNLAPEGSLIGSYAGVVAIDSSLIANNTVGKLIGVSNSALVLRHHTVAYNSLSAPWMFTIGVGPALMVLENSLLVHDGNIQGYFASGGVPITVRNIGASGVGLSGTNVQYLGDPFVDGAHGDYHIDITSSAVDRYGEASGAPLPFVDLEGAARPFVFNNTSEPYDFGAYEAGAVVELIFSDGFDPPFTLPDPP